MKLFSLFKPVSLLAAWLLATALLAAPAASYAQTAPTKMTTTAVPFLTITPDARAAGMGDMGLATTPGSDGYAGLHNGAKTPFATSPGAIGVTYTPWLRDIVQDMYLLSAAGYHQLDDREALSAGLRYFSLGNVAVSDYNGNKLSTSNPREYSFDLGYSRKLSERLGLGLTARYIYSNLGTGATGGASYKAAGAVAADVSVYYDGRRRTGAGTGSGRGEAGEGWTGGLVLSNLGSTINYTGEAGSGEDLPMNLGAGAAYTGVANEDNKWTLGGEVNKPLQMKGPGQSFSNSAYQFSVGGEYGYMNQFFLRLGYVVQTMAEGDLKYVTTGVGFKYAKMGLDFSYLAPSGNGITRNPLSNTFRLGVAFQL
jgi:Type IX secretion system protein PorV